MPETFSTLLLLGTSKKGLPLKCLLAQVRSQTVHILHITDSGKLVVSQKLGTFCRDDDELALSRCREAEQTFHSQAEVRQMRSQHEAHCACHRS